MKRLLITLLLCAAASSGAAVCAQPGPAGVEVFALSTMPLQNVRDARVYYLDGLVQIEEYLSAGLPGDQTQAQAIVAQRISGLGASFKQRAQNAGGGLGRAMQLGVQRAPAVVFDGKYVVYGVTDIDAARRIYSGGRR